MGPTKKKIRREEREADGEGNVLIFIYIFFLSHYSLRYTEIGPSEFVGARSKVLYKTRATRENQKHGISPSF